MVATGPFLFLFLGISAVALFTFLAVAVFSDGRSRERIAYYKQETLKKLAEQPPEKAEVVLEAMRQEERLKHRKNLEGIKLAGLIITMVGLGIIIFLYMLIGEGGVAFAGLVPLSVGLAFLIYGTMMAPAPEDIIPDDRKR